MKTFTVCTANGHETIIASDWTTADGMLILHGDDKRTVAVFAVGYWFSLVIKP